MKKQFILIFVIMFVFDIFSEERNIIEEINIYGGRTIERIFDDNEGAVLNFSKLTQYYDSRGSIVKNIFEHTEEIADSTGIAVQINYYRNNIIEKYEMFLTDAFQSLHGFNRLIEEVNEEDVVTRRIWYVNDTIIDISESAEDGFSFYNIEFIYDEYFRDYQPNERGDVITRSGRYIRIKSVIKFDTVLYELDEADFQLMRFFSLGFGIDNIGHYYSKKVRVYSENRSYWLYVQTQLERYVLGQYATIRYYPIGLNKELYLICIGFYDIRR